MPRNECRPTHLDELKLTEVRKNQPRDDHLRVSLTSAAIYAGRAQPMLDSSLSRVARGAGEFEHQVSLGHTATTVDAQLLNAVVMVLALVVIVSQAVLLVARRFSLQRSISIEDSGSLSEAEKQAPKAWARRTKVALAGAMLFVVLNGVLLIVTNPAPLWLGWLVIGAGIVIVIVGLAIHFSGRCPRCGYMIGFQNALLLPYRCERCKTPLR
jgi:hypothetical protein